MERSLSSERTKTYSWSCPVLSAESCWGAQRVIQAFSYRMSIAQRIRVVGLVRLMSPSIVVFITWSCGHEVIQSRSHQVWFRGNAGSEPACGHGAAFLKDKKWVAPGVCRGIRGPKSSGSCQAALGDSDDVRKLRASHLFSFQIVKRRSQRLSGCRTVVAKGSHASICCSRAALRQSATPET